MSLPSHLSRPTLVRLLHEWSPVAGEASRLDAAERLGEWLSAFDSVKLDAALQAIASYGAQRGAARQGVQPPATAWTDAAGLATMCRRLKADLTGLITAKLPAPVAHDGTNAPDASDATATGYGPHHQLYVALQKQMEAQITACRVHVRQAMSKGSSRLRQLAALDGVLAEMLADREQKLLAAVPVYLERRFAHWQQQQQQQQATDGPNGFAQDMRLTLLAELNVRLQPVLGLIEAAQDDESKRQF